MAVVLSGFTLEADLSVFKSGLRMSTTYYLQPVNLNVPHEGDRIPIPAPTMLIVTDVTFIFAPEPGLNDTIWCNGVFLKFRFPIHVNSFSFFTSYLIDLFYCHHCRIYEGLGTSMDVNHAFVTPELRKIGVLIP
ncbi:hypothetical protein GHT06_008918 [Daphnia sinensis]|uniref:Uncharacterized protein n=1 Tax=Daphnia sinensis TaxID=1820382 RepID=A0AAD5L224_9CRUS|nr:hypothetical protein GHT06_008918 [Daphnia sinensis]